MSLVKSKELFVERAFPVAVDTVLDRTLMQSELHRHEYFEMLYVQRGTLVNRFQDESVTLCAGDVLVMKPYVLHVLEDAPRGRQRRAYCCSFLPRVVDAGIGSLEELKRSGSPNRYFFKPLFPLAEQGTAAVRLQVAPPQRRAARDLLRRLKEACRDPSERAQAITRCRFLDLLAFLAGQHEHNTAGTETTADLAVPVSRYLAGIRRVLNHIHDHFAEPLCLGEMAALSGASETYFCRLFKHETGMSFLQYLNGLRIERARVLLRDTRASAQEIGYRVGFNDYTHFSRQFKQATGCSPGVFRREHRRLP